VIKLDRTPAMLFTLLIACSEPTASAHTNPPPYQKPDDVNVIIVEPASPRSIIAKPGASVDSPPSVRVYNTTISNPVAGATVSFTVMNPDGTVTDRISVKTSSNGIATLPAWRVGQSLGRYWTTASVEGSNAVDFFAWVRGDVIAIYDLVGVEGESYPGPYATEGHYVLFQDGTYNHVYNSSVSENTQFTTVDGTYTRDSLSGVITFSFDGRFSNFYGNLFAEGRPYNGKLRVTYSDPVDFDVELYAPR